MEKLLQLVERLTSGDSGIGRMLDRVTDSLFTQSEVHAAGCYSTIGANLNLCKAGETFVSMSCYGFYAGRPTCCEKAFVKCQVNGTNVYPFYSIMHCTPGACLPAA